MAEKIKNIPSPDILMNSLRSIGYSFKTALADIIDNSISVDAKNIWIDFPSYNSDNLYITILDDAVGMDDAALFNAMKYGSERDEYGDKDLGRFGVGLKSASLSQCRMLTVMSKFNGVIHAYRWDLDEVLRSKEWECLRLDDNEIQACPNYEKLNSLAQGTMVVWQNFDIAEQKSNGHAYEYLSEKLDESENHLCLIFHRFMNRSTSPVSFFMNGRQLKGLDPFLEGSPHHKRNPKTDEGKPVEMAVKYYDKGDEKEAMIKVQTFILPHQDDLSKEDIEALGGMDALKDDQGFFVYRNDRLIIYGTWFRLSSRNVNAELYKYGRIKVDIPNKLDSLWDIDIKKQNAVIPKQIVNLLRKSVMKVCSTSKEKTGRRVKLNDGENEEQIWIKTPSRNGKDTFSINHNSPFVQQCLDSFEDSERARILRMLDAISAHIPFDDIYVSVCNKNQETELSEDKEDSLVFLGIEQFNSIKTIRQCTDEVAFEKLCKYENRIYQHIIPEIGSIALDKLTQNDLQDFYTRLKVSGRLQYEDQQGKGLSDRMVRGCHASCRMALEKAVKEGLITMNPAIGCKLPPKKAREMQVLTHDEMQRFLIQAKHDGYY